MSDVVTTPVVAETSSPVQGITESQAPETSSAPEAAPEAEKKDFLAPKFAALTRKEKQIREMEKMVKAQQVEVERLRGEYEGKTKSAADSEASFLAKLKANPLKALRDHDITFEQLMEMQMNEENPTTDMKMKRMQEELESKYMSKLEKLETAMKDKEEQEANAQWERAVNGYKAELSTYLKNNSETYELTATRPNGIELMFQVAQDVYNQTKDRAEGPKVVSYEELAQAVEQHFEEEAKEILKLKKFQTAAKPAPATKETAKTAPTLSNTLAAEVPKTGKKLLTDDESKRQVAKMIRWNE